MAEDEEFDRLSPQTIRVTKARWEEAMKVIEVGKMIGMSFASNEQWVSFFYCFWKLKK